MRRSLHTRIALGRQKGMTLLEIMIVIAILGLLASVIVVAVMNQFDRAKVSATKLKIKSVEGALHQYNVQEGEYPSNLKALLNPPGGGPPYLKEKGVPKDPWGSELLYFKPPRKGNGPFEVVSKGPDGQEGTDDDLRAK